MPWLEETAYKHTDSAESVNLPPIGCSNCLISACIINLKIPSENTILEKCLMGLIRELPQLCLVTANNMNGNNPIEFLARNQQTAKTKKH